MGPERTATWAKRAPAAVTGRVYALDAVRGLAVLLMIVDHLTYVLDGPGVLRLTLGRAAMPLFFVLSGVLVRRLTWRHGWAFLVGMFLPLIVPWIDSPNVLCWYAVGAALIVGLRKVRIHPAVFVIVALTLSANFWLNQQGTSYDGWALMALMCLGSMVRAHFFAWGDKLPAFVGAIGRAPLAWYVGHLLVLQWLIVAGVA